MGDLTYADNNTLIARYRSTSSERARTGLRDQLVSANMGLVFVCARRMQRRSPRTPLEDLVQEGVFGLLDVIDSFDLSRGLQFSTYAFACIEGTIARAIDGYESDRAQLGMSYDLQAKLRYVGAADQAFRTLHGRAPDTAELLQGLHCSPYAEAQRMTLEQVEECLRLLSGRTISLDAPIFTGDGEAVSRHERVADVNVDIEVTDDARRLSERVERAVTAIIAALLFLGRERDAKIFRLRFGFDDYSKPLILEDIGQRYGLTRERIRGIVSEVFGYLQDNGFDVDEDRFSALLTTRDELRRIVGTASANLSSSLVRERIVDSEEPLDIAAQWLEQLAAVRVSAVPSHNTTRKVIYKAPEAVLEPGDLFPILCEHRIERPNGERYIPAPIAVLEARAELTHVQVEGALRELEELGYIALDYGGARARLLVDPPAVCLPVGRAKPVSIQKRIHTSSSLAPHHEPELQRRRHHLDPRGGAIVYGRRLDDVYESLRARVSRVDGRRVLRGAIPLLGMLYQYEVSFAELVLLLLKRLGHIQQLDGWRAIELRAYEVSDDVVLVASDLWASAGCWSRHLPLSAATIRKRGIEGRIRSIALGRDPWGSPYRYYSLTDIERECADLIEAPQGDSLGILELDGERYATCKALVWEINRHLRYLFEVSTIRRFVCERDDIRTFEGRQWHGPLVTFYHVDDVLTAYQSDEAMEQSATS